jgi:PAS domain S-box-containing protein
MQPHVGRQMAETTPSADPALHLRRRGRRIAVTYVLIAAAWILGSEWVLAMLASDPEALLRISAVKGMAFVLVTGILLYALLRGVFSRIAQAVDVIRHNEQVLQRLTRLHRARAEVSRAIARTSSRQELLTECCRAIVESGGFGMGWIGWADEAGQSLDPVAHSGDDSDFLADLVIPTDDSPEGRGPSGRAFREDRPQISNDLLSDPTAEPWWDRAGREGVCASAAFPIRRGGRPCGVLTVHARQCDVFQEEEVELLAAVADEVGAALDNLELDARRTAAEDAAEAERRLSDMMIATGPGIMFLYDTAGRFLRWNPTIERISGYDAAEIATMTVADLVPDADRDDVASAMGRAVASGSAEIEIDLLTKDGRRIPYLFLGRSVEVDGTTGLVVTGIDISERAAAESALRESEAETRALIEAIPHMMWITRPDGHHIDFNRRWLEYTGRTLEQSLGHGWNPAFHPDDRDRADEAWDAAIATGEPYEIEYRLRRADGTHHWMLGRALPMRDETGTIVKWVGTCTDIDELKAAQTRVAEQAALLDLTQDAILVLDLDRRVQYWNAGAEMMFGWTAAEAVGAPLGDLHDPDPDQHDVALQALLQRGEWAGELRCTDRSGAELLVESRWTLLRDDDGNPQSVLAVDTDVTERRGIERQFLRAQRFESIGTLAGGIAHDLNNLLVPIVMGVALFRDQRDPRMQVVIDAMEQSAQRGSDLVKQVMSFAKGVDGERSEIAVPDVVDEVIAIASSTFPKDLEIRRDMAEDLWPVVADATQLHQVLLNLCVNARDAMPDGGVISVTASNHHIDAQYAEMDRRATAGPHVLIEVADQGSGMSPEVLDHIFEPFFTTKQPDGGTGLGLSTVMNIVRSHDGFVDVRSQIGRGTTFSVHLPAQAAARTRHPSMPDAEARPRGDGELVLVVDDEAIILDITSRTLESFGYRVMTAPDGAEAMGTFAMHQPEIAVVLTDMMMPVMDGAGLIGALRSLDPSLPVVATSGVSTSGADDRALAAGAQAFLAKPYSAELLLSTLREVLDGRPSTDDRRAAGAHRGSRST